MAESNSLEQLFKVGMSREQFIDKYTELQQTSEKKESSIFSDKISSSIGQIFDMLNADGNETLDENELLALKALDNSDGDNVLSDSDLNVIYDKLSKKITEDFDNNTPQQSYDKAVTNGEQSTGDYIQTLSSDIDIIEALISAREDSSQSKLDEYQTKIDDLVMKSSKLSNEFKAGYKDLSSKIKKMKKDADKISAQMKDKENQIDEVQNNIQSIQSELQSADESTNPDDVSKKQKELEKYKNNYSDYQSSYQDLSSKRASIVSSISNETTSLSTMSKTAQTNDSSLKTKIDDIKAKMNVERESAKSDITTYQAQLQKLQAAQSYALSQVNPSGDVITDDYSDEDTANFNYDAKALKSKWNKKAPWLSDAFYSKTTAISQRLGCDPNDLMAVMYSESGLKSTAGNKNGGATGLIQFLPSTAKSLGTTTSALRNMSAEQQLSYVEKCIAGTKKMAGFKSGDKLDTGTLYSLVFLPAFAKREVLTSKGSKYYAANAGLDTNHDGQITKSDLRKRLQKFKA